MDQAANLSEVLAWSFSLKSVLRTANIFDVSLDTLMISFLISALGHAVKSLMEIVVSKQVEGLHKASGLELLKPQGAQAEGLCSLGTVRTVITGPERGH